MQFGEAVTMVAASPAFLSSESINTQVVSERRESEIGDMLFEEAVTMLAAAPTL
jgi:hypothetical protein